MRVIETLKNVEIPEDVNVKIDGRIVTVRGEKGELTRDFSHTPISIYLEEKMISAHESLADRGVPLATNQVQFSLLHRKIEHNGVLETAKELGVSITAYTPLGMGILTGKLHSNPELLNSMPRFRRSRLRGKIKKSQPLVDALEEIAREQEATAAQVALSWTTNYHGGIVVTIPGASKTYQIEQNAGAMSVSLSSEQMDTLAALSADLTGR